MKMFDGHMEVLEVSPKSWLKDAFIRMNNELEKLIPAYFFS